MPAAGLNTDPDFCSLTSWRHVALAVSGGSDSMGLLRLVHDWTTLRAHALEVSVLTVDHGLRPESAAEARQVGDWSQELGLPHHILRWEGEKPHSGLQARARTARYDLMTEWALSHGAEAILTAHTIEDQAETVLMRLRRTASPASLAGIAAKGQWRSMALLRPLLACRRQDIRGHLIAAGQEWIEDPSNTDRRFERVRVRDEIAGLAQEGVTLKRLARLSAAGARTEALLERCARQWLALHLDEQAAGVCHAPLAAFVDLPGLLRQRIMGLIVCHYGGGRLRPEPKELARLVECLDGGPVRRTLAGAVIGRRKNGFWVTRESSRIDGEPLVIGVSGQALWDGRFRIAAPEGSAVTAAQDEAPELGGQTPLHARRAYPRVAVPGNLAGDEVRIAFQRLTPS